MARTAVQLLSIGIAAAGIPAQLSTLGLYGLRATGRTSLPAAVAKSIEGGLMWLADHQDSDGSWDPVEFMKHDPVGFKCTGPGNAAYRVGVTGLALLAFLADNNTLDHGPHKSVVKRGIDWLVKQQATTGPTSGLIGSEFGGDFYSHLYATHALVETHGLSRAKDLEAKARAAVDYVQRHRHADFAWRYRPQEADEDTSVTVLAFAVLATAQSFGIEIDRSHAAATKRFLDKPGITFPDGITGYHKSLACSSRRDEEHIARFPPKKTCLTAAALFCRFMLGQRADETPVMRQQAALVQGDLPLSQPDFYYWYYASLAMKQAGGSGWRMWSSAVRRKLLKLQRKKPSRNASTHGSWDPDTVWGQNGGRIYTTAIAVLTLQTPYRYARISELTPVSADLARFSVIRQRWIKRDFGGVAKAMGALRSAPAKPDEEERAALAALDAALERESKRALREVGQWSKGPDYLASHEALKKIADRFDGLLAAKEAKLQLESFAQSIGIRKEIKAMRVYRMVARRKTGRLHALYKLAADYEGTHAAALAVADLANRPKK